MDRVQKFFREVRMELSKVHWPSRLETTVLTVLVIAMLVVLTVIIFAYDTLFSNLVGQLLGIGTR